MSNYSLKTLCCQSKDDKFVRWNDYKRQSEDLAVVYDVINPDKADKLRLCSKFLVVHEFSDGFRKVVGAASCKQRLCPLCTWRKSVKVFRNTSRIIDKLENDVGYSYLFLTLTMRNCRPDELSSELDIIFAGWNKLSQYRPFKNAVKGWYRGIEVTHDTDQLITQRRYDRFRSYHLSQGLHVGDVNPRFNSYHPHVHIILVVNKSYFTSRNYIAASDFSKMWRRSCALDYDPVIDVRKVYGNIKKSVAEVSKYSAKSSEYITDDISLSVDSVSTLDSALAGRRLAAYGGVMREAFRALKLEDSEEGSLADEASEASADDFEVVSYFWHSGYNRYLRDENQ